MYIFAGIIAALVSYICNKVVLKIEGGWSVTVLVPFIEEVTKTLSAIFFSTNIIFVHFIFGVIEGIYDISTSHKSIGKLAALASILSHTFFGLGTYLTIRVGFSVYWGIFLGWIIHSTWNWYIMKHT